MFFLIPMFTMLSASFQEGTSKKASYFTGYWQNYTNDFAAYDTQLSTAPCLRIDSYGRHAGAVLPVAYWIACRGGKRKNLLPPADLLPFFTPFIIRTLAWKQILADNSIILGTLKDWTCCPRTTRFSPRPQPCSPV